MGEIIIEHCFRVDYVIPHVQFILTLERIQGEK